jgi:hypothetical protein
MESQGKAWNGMACHGKVRQDKAQKIEVHANGVVKNEKW